MAAVHITDLTQLPDGHFRFTVVLFHGEIEICACRARWNGRHVINVLPPFSVLPGGRCRAQVRWSESLREKIRAQAEIAILAHADQRGGARENPRYGTAIEAAVIERSACPR